MTTISNIDVRIKTGDISSAIKLLGDLGNKSVSAQKALDAFGSVDLSKLPPALKDISTGLTDIKKNANQAKTALNDLTAATRAAANAGASLQSSSRAGTVAINAQITSVNKLISSLKSLNAQANTTNMTPKGSASGGTTRSKSYQSQSQFVGPKPPAASSNASSVAQSVAKLASSATSSGSAMTIAATGARALSAALGPVGVAVGAVVSALIAMIGPMREADKYSQMMSRGFATIGVSGAQAQSTLVDVANKAGVAYSEIARAYLSYSVAANESGVTNQQATRTFEAVTMAINRTGGSSEQAQRALLALSQMMSKGTVASEELKGQLGEALPGAVAAGARAMKMDVASFLKEVGDGKVVAKDFVDALTSELERANKATAGMSDNFSANITKMGNSISNMTLRLMTAAAEASNTMFALQKLAGVMDRMDKGGEVFDSLSKGMAARNNPAAPKDEQQFRKAASDNYIEKIGIVGKGNGAIAEAAKFFTNEMRKPRTDADKTFNKDNSKVAAVEDQIKNYMAEGKLDQAKALKSFVDGYSGLMVKGKSGYEKDQANKKEKQEVDDATNRIGADKARAEAALIRRNNPVEKAQNAINEWDKATAALIKGKTGSELERIKAQRDAGRAELEIKKQNAEESESKKGKRSNRGSNARKELVKENKYNNIQTDIEQNTALSNVGQNEETQVSLVEEINAKAREYLATLQQQYNAGSLSLSQYRDQYAVQDAILKTAEKEADIKVKYLNAQTEYEESQKKILDNTEQKIASELKLKTLTDSQAQKLVAQAKAQYETNVSANKTALAQREIAELTALQDSRQKDVNKSLTDQESKLAKIIAKQKEAIAAAANNDKRNIQTYVDENNPDREADPSGFKKKRNQYIEDSSSNSRTAADNADAAVKAQRDLIVDKGDAATPEDQSKLQKLEEEAQRARAALDDVKATAGSAFDEIDAKQNSVAGGLKEGYLQYLESMPTFAERSKQAISGLSDAFSQFNNGFAKGQAAVKQWASTMLQQITAVIVKSLILAAIQSATGTGSFGSNFTGNLKSSVGIKQAKGGAWDNGVQKFAKGGTFTNSIVDKPTNFGYAGGIGQMGEAGPEAIVPLKRGSDGSLGVRAAISVASPMQQPLQQSGSSAAPVFNITVNTSVDGNSDVGKDPDKLSAMISEKIKTEVSSRVSTAMVNMQRPGGALYGR